VRRYRNSHSRETFSAVTVTGGAASLSCGGKRSTFRA
jgi:hypothetical protein